MGDGTGDEDGIVVGTRDGDLSCCRSGGAAVDVSDGVGEGGRGVLSLRQRGEIEGLDLVAAVWLDGELNVLVLSRAIGIGEVEGDGDGLADVGRGAVDGMDRQRVIGIVNIGGAAEEVAGGGIDVDAVLELIF